MKDKSKVVLAGLVAVSFLAPASAAPLKYSYRITSPQKVVETKPGALNDGSAKTVAYWKGARGVVVCELPAATEVAEVAVTVKKTTNWYLMTEVEVAVDGDGSGEYNKPKSVPIPVSGYDGKPPVIDASCTNITLRVPVAAKAVKVKVVVKTRAWGAISEIVLDDGKESECKVQSAKCKVQSAGCRVQGAECRVQSAKSEVKGSKLEAESSKSDVAADLAALPKNLTTVENKYFRMLVTPLGGRALSLHSKFLDVELTCVKAEAGTFTEFDWSRRGNKWFYIKKPFDLKPFKGDGIIGLQMRGNARGGGTDFLVIDKKYTLRDDSTALRVDYEFGNLPDAMAAQIYGMLVHTTLGINGRLCSYYFPSEEGIVEIERDKRPQERWIHHPTRGWMAAVDDLGRGVAITMPFREVKAFYSWLAQDVVPTLEWRMIPVSIENGKSYSVAMDVITFKGLSRVSGAGGGLVGEISDGTVKVFNSRKGKVTAKIKGDGKGEGEVELVFTKPGEVRSFKSNAKTVILEIDGKEVCRLEAPPEAGAWTMSPLEPSRASDMKSFDLTGYTNFTHQACTPFAKPLAAKRPRVIALTGTGNNAELGFFADRFDCEMLTTSISLDYYRNRPKKRKIQNPQHDNGDYFGSLSTADVEENLLKVLKKDADAILVGGLPWEIFPKAAQKLILEKVKAGCGLVWIGQDRDEPEIFRTGCSPKMVRAAPVAVGEAFADVPFALLGAEPSYAFKAEGATVHAKAGDTPWLTENALGKGRVIHLPYAAIFGNLNNTTGITPNLRDYYPDRVAPSEYYYSLIAKCILRAANVEMPAAFRKVKVQGEGEGKGEEILTSNLNLHLNLHLNLNLNLQPSPLTFQWWVRNRYGEAIAKGNKPVSLKAGVNALSVPLAGLAPYAGPLALEAVLRDGDGRVMTWGAWAFENRPAASLASFAADRDAAKGEAYREGDTVRFKVKVKGEGKGEGEKILTLTSNLNLNLKLEFRDSFGRLLDEKVEAINSQLPTPNSQLPTINYQVSISNELPARMYEATARLMEGGREIDRLRAEVRARPNPAKWPWDDFVLGIWTGERVREYLWPEFAKLFRSMHLTANIANQWRMAIDFPARHGFDPTLLSGAGLAKCTEPEAYVKTGDKTKLVRKPCLSDPAFFAKQEKSLSATAKRIANIGVRYVWFGDEQSLTGYGGTPIDFCFSPHCLAEFRKFLKERYGTLERLNEEWGPAFAKWDDVLPFTRQEVWAEGGERHVAGWADHLEFMDGRLANSLAYSRKLLKDGDPNVMASMSGTQPPTAYGGMDWWRQARVLDSALNYCVGGQMDLLRSFNPDGKYAPWNWGYSSLGNRAAQGLWKTLFDGAAGITGFHDLSIFNPDWTWSGGYRDVKPGMDRVAFGVGRHVMNNFAMKPQVAVLYSQASIRAAFFESRAKGHAAMRDKYISLLRHLGFTFDFVSYEQLEDGTFESRPYKALILADACAMSDAEVAAVRRFVAKGGAVLADGVPARRKANLRPRGALPLAGCAKVLSEKPDAGYVKALEYPTDAANAAAIAAEQDRLEAALVSAGVDQPRLQVRDAVNGSRVREVSTWVREGRHGELFFGVVFGGKGASRLVDFVFPKKGWVCDLASGAEIGGGEKFRLPLAKARPNAFELLAKKPEGFRVSSNGSKVLVEYARDVDTVVNMKVVSPSGEEIWYYTRKLSVLGGRAEHEIPFAMSDGKGMWRVVATDIITGETQEKEVRR